MLHPVPTSYKELLRCADDIVNLFFTTGFIVLAVSAIFFIVGIAMLFLSKPKIYNHYCPGKDWEIEKYDNVQINETGNNLESVADSFRQTYQDSKKVAIYIDKSVSGECYVVLNSKGIVGIFPTDSYVYSKTA